GAACLAVAAAATTVVALRPSAGAPSHPGAPTATGTGPVVATGAPSPSNRPGPSPAPTSTATPPTRPSGPPPSTATSTATRPANPPAHTATSAAPGAQPCRASDFGTVTAQGDSAAGMIAYDILIPVAHRCTLPALPTVHLVDPTGGPAVLL